MKSSLWPIRRQLFEIFYFGLALICTLWLAIALQAGDFSTYLFVRNDVLTEPKRLAFMLGFPCAYLVSLLVVGYILRLPRFDFVNRTLATNILVYSFLGLTLSALRLPLFSREVFISEFFLSLLLLIAYHKLRHNLFPRLLGVLHGTNITPFAEHPLLEVEPVDITSAQSRHFDGIVTNLRGPIDADTSRAFATLAQQRIPVHDANNLVETLWGRVPLSNLSSVEVDSFKPPIFYLWAKRIIDFSLIIAFAPLLVPLILIISIAIKLDSPGPIFFFQSRTGIHGSSFTIIKFRSMVADPKRAPTYARQLDKRITRVGRVLRRLRLDELPQLWNILRGEMSLIGPRPEQLEFSARFNRHIAFYGYRHTLRPGITGWAQVMYGYTTSDEETRAKLEFDFFYIKHMSPWLDLVVIAKTIQTIVLGSGAR